jgi:Ca-activated chloride channel family protein
MFAAGCVIVALAQPRWGRSGDRQLPPGHDVVLALDVSRSMGARDAVPDRLSVAVTAAESLLEALGQGRGDRVAVVAFAGRGVLRCPLTENLGAALEALRKLGPGDVTPGGTDLAAGLNAALQAFDDHDHAEGRSVVLFSDGEDQANAWEAALEPVAGQAVVVHTVAVGDADAGHTVPARVGAGPGREPLVYKGQVVLSKRADAPLEAIASATGGAVLKLGLAPVDLGSLYHDRIEAEARSRRAVTSSG